MRVQGFCAPSLPAPEVKERPGISFCDSFWLPGIRSAPTRPPRNRWRCQSLCLPSGAWVVIFPYFPPPAPPAAGWQIRIVGLEVRPRGGIPRARIALLAWPAAVMWFSCRRRAAWTTFSFILPLAPFTYISRHAPPLSEGFPHSSQQKDNRTGVMQKGWW